MGNKLDRYYRNIPKVFKPENNAIWNALVQGFAQEDEEISTQLDNTKAQLFIASANGVYLDRLASALNVERPVTIGLSDEKYRELIPNLSLKYKQIRKTFYDTMDVFWGPTYSRANVTSLTYAPFNIVVGNEFKVKIDGGEEKTVKVKSGDLVTSGAMTILELIAFINQIPGITASEVRDAITSRSYLNVRTNTPGLKGSIEITSASILGVAKLDLTIGKYEIWQQKQRTVIYEINPDEIIIEIPAIVPALRRTLKGSHHFHADATLAGPVAPNNGIWQGSFIFDPDNSTYTISGQKCKLQTSVLSNGVQVAIDVDDNSDFLETSGELIFDFGTDKEEYPVKYRGIPNSHTILIDPSHVFQYTHDVNSYVNALVSTKPLIPRENGDDLAVYLTSPANARAVVQTILESLAAAGVVIDFVIILPEYKYLITNPYI